MGGLGNLVRGMYTGAATTLDPFGTGINHFDSWTSAASMADRERAIPTVAARAYQSAYPDFEDAVPFWGGYVPRFFGNMVGTAGMAAGLAGIGYMAAPLVGPIVSGTAAYTATTAALTGAGLAAGTAATVATVGAGALVIPAALGIYGIARAIGRYAHDYVYGEKFGKKSGRKGRFYGGFRFGWHQATHLESMLGFHDLEHSLTGRGPYDSHIDNTITDSSRYVRRNFASLAGGVTGVAVGVGALAALFYAGTVVAGPVGGIVAAVSVPFYKSIRDWIRSYRTVRDRETPRQRRARRRKRRSRSASRSTRRSLRRAA